MKASILLIPILLLSSCTIDWNDEKDKKIIELNTKIAVLENTLEKIEIEKNEHGKDNSHPTKDFGSGFTFSQTDEATVLNYSGKVIKTWSHTPPEKVPFIWDEACIDFFEAIDMVSQEERNKNTDWKQEVWNRFDMNSKKNCMKEYLSRSIGIQSVTDRFTRISQSYYETGDSWIYDKKTGNIHQIPEVQGVLTIEETPDTIKIHVKNERGPTGGYDVTYNTDFSKLLTEKVYSYEEMKTK